MNLNPLQLFRGIGKTTDPTRNQGGAIARSTHDAAPMGPWSTVLGAWQPRHADPWLYEALREAVPVLDGGIARMVTMDGIVDVEGQNQKLVDEIREWMRTVPVNDVESGYQAFYASMGDEHYEQGIGVGEFVYDAKGRDVVGLRVADSKGIVFVREAGGSVCDLAGRRTVYNRDNPVHGELVAVPEGLLVPVIAALTA